MTPVAFLDMGFPELVVVGIVALLLFGGRLPEVMRTMGTVYRNLRKSWEDLSRQAFDPVRSIARDVYQPTAPKQPYVGAPSTQPAPATPGTTSDVTFAAPLPTQPPAAGPSGQATGISSAPPAQPVPSSAPTTSPSRYAIDDDLPLV